MHVDGLRVALGARPPLRYWISFFFVSPQAGPDSGTRAPGASELRIPGWRPSSVLRLAWRLYPGSWSSRFIVRSLTRWPRKTVRQPCGTVTPQRALRIAARHRFKLARHHQPRIRCARRRGDANVLKESHSKTPNQAPPARTVPIPVASTTRPMARAAAHRRRARSSRTGRNTTNLDRSVSTIASMTSSMADPHQKTIYFGAGPKRSCGEVLLFLSV